MGRGWKRRRTAHSERSARGFDVLSQRLQLLDAAVSLFTAPAARFARLASANVFSLLRRRWQCLQVIKPSLIDFGMMTTQDDAVLA